MSEQLVFSPMVAAAEARQRLALDRHRQEVQSWFDALGQSEKDRLAEWFARFEWDTCAALAAAAGDWHHCRRKRHESRKGDSDDASVR
jgi:hypothetical protein